MTRRFGLLLTLLLCHHWVFGQQPVITFKVTGGAGKQAGLATPVNGEVFAGTFKALTLDSSGTVQFHNTAKVPGAWHFRYKRMYTLYVPPGGSCSLMINEKDTANPIVITGPDVEGQLLLNKLELPFSQREGMMRYRQDSIFDNNRKFILASLHARLEPFEALYRARRISEGFHTYVTNMLSCYYASILGATLMAPLGKMEFDKTKPGYSEAAIREADAQWQQVLSVADIRDRRLATSLMFNEYTVLFHLNYLGYFLPQKEGTFRRTDNKEERAMQLKAAILRYYKGSMLEYQLANWLGELMQANNFESFIPAEYQAFHAAYPHSGFNPILEKGAREVMAYLEKARSGPAASQVFVSHYEKLTSFKDLAASFPGKTVYVDLWATWCGPCKEEFTHLPQLKALLKEHGVDALYISIDRPVEEQRWKDMIRYYGLDGHHLRASEPLMKDIRAVFGNDGTLSIPRYAILKNGQLVLASARPPSDLKGLEAQLKQIITAQ